MNIREIVNLLDAQVLCCEDSLETDIHSACGSDMMSDVLAYVKDQAALLTGLINPQVIRTAMMMDMRCVIFVRSKQPLQEMVDLASENGIVILTTNHRMFEACGILYAKGLGNAEASDV